MKTCTLCVAMLFCTSAFNATNAQARVCVFCASNLSEQPSWGPAGYDFVYYYYLPEIEVYYYVPNHQFTYQKDGIWITSNTLPLRYAAFNFYKAYKVVMNDDNVEPYLEHNINKVEYASYKSKHDQPVNRDSEEFKRARERERQQAISASDVQ